MEKLALLGGKPILENPLPISNTIGIEEKKAVEAVLDSGILSDFVGVAGEKFLGGKEVRALEAEMCAKFKVKHAVSFNSATTALEAAVTALGIGPGDEVIVSPYTMSASALAILMNMAVPIFADIEEDTFCLSPASIKARITPRTKAIMVTNLFGGAARYDEILKIAREHNLKIIEDNAQAPSGTYNHQFLGTISDIGIFSFNFHKVIHCGEGGVLVTNNDKYAFRAQLKRNHGEVALDNLNNLEEFIFGSNYRLSEVHAAIAREQLKKLDFLVEKRIELANYLTEKLRKFPGIVPASVLPESKHAYYVYPFRFIAKEAGISRDVFALALEKEGLSVGKGYVKPLYLINLFQERKIFPRSHFPFDANPDTWEVTYPLGLCPVTERLWKEELLMTTICRYPLTKEHIDLFVAAIEKVYANKEELLNIQQRG